MRFFLLAGFLLGAMAMPTDLGPRDDDPAVCSGQLPNPVCCQPDALGLSCMNGTAPAETPRDAHKFSKLCEDTGGQPRCCDSPTPSQGSTCMQPAPTKLSDFKDGFKDGFKGSWKDQLTGGNQG